MIVGVMFFVCVVVDRLFFVVIVVNVLICLNWFMIFGDGIVVF